MKRLITILAVFLFITLPLRAQTIKKIEIIGNGTLPLSKLKSIITEKPGQKLSLSGIDTDIKRIYSTGFYKNVVAYVNQTGHNATVIFKLFPQKPIFNLKFLGNKHISSKEILKYLGLNSTESEIPFSQSQLEVFKSKIEELLKSKGFVNAEVSISEFGKNATFVIKEGPRAQVCRVIIEGNKAFSDSKIKGILKTKERSILHLRFHAYLNETAVHDDVKRIKNFYISHGFLDVKVGKPVISRKGNCFYVTFRILNEGKRYKFGKISFKGAELFSKDELLKPFKKELYREKWFNEAIINQIASYVSAKYGELGFIYASVIPKLEIDKKKGLVNVTFVIKRGPRARIRHINIEGNFETRDRTIRRELDFYETEVFNTQKLGRSLRRLYNMGYFKTVNVNPKIYGNGSLDVNLKVSERLTGLLQFGGGYSSMSGLVMMLNLKKGNLFGTGDNVALSFQGGSKIAYYDLFYTHRWWLNEPQTLTLSLFNRKNDFTTYTSHRVGGSVGVERRIDKDWQVGLSYTYQKTTISNISDNASDIIKEQEGTKRFGLLGSTISRDLRDNRFLPHRGTFLQLSNLLAWKAMLSDDDFYRSVLDASKYIYLDDYSERFKIPIVLSAHLKLGYADTFGPTDQIPLDYRFYVGGDTTVRGYSWGEAGPKDAEGNPIGADRELVLNLEAGYDVNNFFRIIAFYDVGGGWWAKYDLKNVRIGAGVGMRILTPIGPLRLDLGWKIHRREGESPNEWHFGVGTYF